MNLTSFIVLSQSGPHGLLLAWKICSSRLDLVVNQDKTTVLWLNSSLSLRLDMSVRDNNLAHGLNIHNQDLLADMEKKPKE